MRRQEAMGSKVLKVLNLLKVLNFSGAGKITIFTCTFTVGRVAPGWVAG